MTDEIDTKSYTIQNAAVYAGLSAHTIRAWEKRYQALTPERSPNGKRLYNSNEIERLKTLALLVNLGSTISQIANLSDQELYETYLKLSQTKDRYLAPKPQLLTSSREIYEEILHHVEKFEINIVSELLTKARSSLAPRRLALEVIYPLIQVLQVKKNEGHFKLAHVQALMALIKFQAGFTIFTQIEKETAHSKKFVLTSIEETQSSLSLILTALLCCHHQKKFFYLNSNLPGESMVEAFLATKSHILVINLMDAKSPESVRKTLEQIPENIELWLVGGNNEFSKNHRKSVTHLKDLQELDRHLENHS